MNITVSVRQSRPSLCPTCKAGAAPISVHTPGGGLGALGTAHLETIVRTVFGWQKDSTAQKMQNDTIQ